MFAKRFEDLFFNLIEGLVQDNKWAVGFCMFLLAIVCAATPALILTIIAFCLTVPYRVMGAMRKIIQGKER